MAVGHIYGTTRVLCGLRAVQVDPNSTMQRKAVEGLKQMQNVGGGWGEAANIKSNSLGTPTAVESAWGLQGLIAADEAWSNEIEMGVEWLLANRSADGNWIDDAFLGRDPRGPHRHRLCNLAYPLVALAEIERRFGHR